MKARLLMAVVTITALLSAPFSYAADDDIGIFQMLRVSSVSFDETTAAVDAALEASDFDVHATHDVRLPDDRHRARVYVLTSPDFAEAAAGQDARTVSAQVLRIGVYTTGGEQETYINMANPVAHAMVYYADSPDYDELVAAARATGEKLREVVSVVPGESSSAQMEPMRAEKHYRKFNGDGPARMMAKFRRFDKSQLVLLEDTAENFDAVVEKVVAAVAASDVSDASDSTGWEQVARIDLRDDAVYLGLTNPFIEDRMVQINSRFRNEDKNELSPYPGVDHVTALPTDVLVIKEDGKTLALHYGQMWRMQLYFWDSGYRAFTANVGVPGAIANSIEETVQGE